MARRLLLSCATCAAFVSGESNEIIARLPTTRPFNLAIIGSGSAGSSTAYHVSKFAAAVDVPINITIFEREARPGGRTTTVNAFDDVRYPVELGASIFVEVNKILMDAVEEFNLSTSTFRTQDADPAQPDLGVWDGEKFVFVQMRDDGWWDRAKLFWKYGLAPIKTIRLMKSTVGKFLKLYDEPVFPWLSLSQAVQDVGLLDVVTTTGERLLIDNGILGDFGHDIVQASTRVNYAQNLKYIHGLEAMVCMAATGGRAVTGGNWQIFAHMVQRSGARTLFNTTVTHVEKQAKRGYTINANYEDRTVADPTVFDGIVLAAPHQFSGIEFSPKLAVENIPYVELHVTLFTSSLQIPPAFFGLQPNEKVPRTILTTMPKGETPEKGPQGCGSVGFWAFSLLRQVRNPQTGAKEYLYKMFSPEAMGDASIRSIWDGIEDYKSVPHEVTWIHRKVWNSYPYEYPRVTFEDILLDDNFYYTAGIESLASAMESSALMGKNVAGLIVDHLQGINSSSSSREDASSSASFKDSLKMDL